MSQSKQESEAAAIKAVTKRLTSPRFSWGVDDLKQIKAPPKEASK